MSAIHDIPLPVTFIDGMAFNAFAPLPAPVRFETAVLVEVESVRPPLDDELEGRQQPVPEPSVVFLLAMAFVYVAVRK
jgi:hypothetical protein